MTVDYLVATTHVLIMLPVAVDNSVPARKGINNPAMSVDEYLTYLSHEDFSRVLLDIYLPPYRWIAHLPGNILLQRAA